MAYKVLYINGREVKIKPNLYYELKDEAYRRGLSIQAYIERLYKGKETGKRYYHLAQRTKRERREWLN